MLKSDFLMKLNFSNERNTTPWTPFFFFFFFCDVSLACLVFFFYMLAIDIKRMLKPNTKKCNNYKSKVNIDV